MKNEYCARLFVQAIDDADCCVDEVGRPFTGQAGAQTAICDCMREMIAEQPDRNWRSVYWVAQLHVYEGSKPDLHHLVDEIDLEVRYFDGRESGIDLPQEQYFCFAPDSSWHTDYPPDNIVGALGDSHDPWCALTDPPDGLVVTWLNRYSGQFAQLQVELRAKPHA